MESEGISTIYSVSNIGTAYEIMDVAKNIVLITGGMSSFDVITDASTQARNN
jgi:hypothetical protein